MVKTLRINTYIKQIILIVFCFAILIFAVFFVSKFISKKSASVPVVSATLTPSDFVGTWTLVGSTNFDNSVLTISDPTATGFTFDVEAQSGGDSGSWKNYDDDSKSLVGNIALDKNIAHYVDDASNPIYHHDDGTTDAPCTGDFALSDDNATLDLSTDCSDTYAGFGVSFDGTYSKTATVATTTIETSDLFVNNNESMYQAFSNLVGTYIDAFNQTVALEDDESYTDVQLGNITTASFALPHAYAESQSIVVLGSKNSIWAAVIDSDPTSQQSVVRYFTTEPVWKNTLPQVIKDWMANFNDDTIVYESK